MITLVWILVGVIILSIGIGVWMAMMSRRTKEALVELIEVLREVVVKLSEVAGRVEEVAEKLEEINSE